MRSLKVAVVGCGFWGLNHARVLKELEGAELVAVSDVDPARAKQAGARYGVPWFTENEELFKRSGAEAVTICTPSSTHVEVALQAIEHGLNLFVEKPLASTAEEALKVVKAAEEGGVKLMVGHIERFNPGVRRVKSILREGGVGDVVLMSSRRVSAWPARVGDVGVVKDLAVHDLDVMRYLADEEPREVYAVAGRLKHAYEDYAHIVLKFPSEVGFIEANWLTPRKVRRLTVTCTEGIVTLDYITQEVAVEDEAGMRIPPFKWEEPLKLELQSFVSALLRGGGFEVDGVDGYRALCLAEAALRSASSGSAVEVRYSL